MNLICPLFLQIQSGNSPIVLNLYNGMLWIQEKNKNFDHFLVKFREIVILKKSPGWCQLFSKFRPNIYDGYAHIPPISLKCVVIYVFWAAENIAARIGGYLAQKLLIYKCPSMSLSIVRFFGRGMDNGVSPPLSILFCIQLENFQISIISFNCCFIINSMNIINLEIFQGYSARALGSSDVENFHSVLNHLDRRGVQTSTLTEINQQMSTMQTLQILRKSSAVAR